VARIRLGSVGAALLVDLGARRLPEGHPQRFAAAEDVPLELALPMAPRDTRDAPHDGDALGPALLCGPISRRIARPWTSP
jgi:hypothetical protein